MQTSNQNNPKWCSTLMTPTNFWFTKRNSFMKSSIFRCKVSENKSILKNLRIYWIVKFSLILMLQTNFWFAIFYIKKLTLKTRNFKIFKLLLQNPINFQILISRRRWNSINTQKWYFILKSSILISHHQLTQCTRKLNQKSKIEN